jgi:hypothetical chaperone protein
VLGIGIDFGTSNSTVALYDGDRLHYADVRGPRDAPEVMPTALYLDQELQSEVGLCAIEQYLQENSGRSIELSREEVGTIEVTVAGTDSTSGPKAQEGTLTNVFSVHAYTDKNLPGRLFRGVKRWLGNSTLERVRVFDVHFRIVALITPVLLHMRAQAERSCGGRAERVHVGHPVRFEGRGEESNRIALERLAEACQHAEIPGLTLYPEPVAAALGFLHGRKPRDKETLLAFDFGGGTLDLTVLRVVGETFEILATHGVPLGGNAIDRTIYEAKLFPELGRNTPVQRPFGPELRTIPFDFHPFADRLLNWALAYELNRPDFRERIIQDMRTGGESGRKLGRLYELITRNHAYRVFQAIERAKVELSSRPRAVIEVPELDLAVPLERNEFETLIERLLDEMDAAVKRVLELAGLPARDVNVVVRTGGSSKIPAVIRRLDARFPDRVVEHDPFTSIAAGLALASFHGYSA